MTKVTAVSSCGQDHLKSSSPEPEGWWPWLCRVQHSWARNLSCSAMVGILIFISMINTTSERLTARNFIICPYFSFMSSWNSMLSLVEHKKGFITSGLGLPWSTLCQYQMCFWMYLYEKTFEKRHNTYLIYFIQSDNGYWIANTLFSEIWLPISKSNFIWSML